MATRNIVPNTNNAGAIGLDAKRWAFGHFQVLKQAGKVVATTDQIPVVPVTSVNGKVGTVVLSHTDVGAATSAQGELADTASQPGHTHASSDIVGFNSDAVAAVVAALNSGSINLVLKNSSDNSLWLLGVTPEGQLFTTKQ